GIKPRRARQHLHGGLLRPQRDFVPQRVEHGIGPELLALLRGFRGGGFANAAEERRIRLLSMGTSGHSGEKGRDPDPESHLDLHGRSPASECPRAENITAVSGAKWRSARRTCEDYRDRELHQNAAVCGVPARCTQGTVCPKMQTIL